MSSKDKYFSELDKDLQQLALVDWETFVRLVGEDAIISAKVCILRSRSKSINQIASRLSVTKNQVEYRCKKCEVSDQLIMRGSNQ
ncbi:MAG: hypothetical protein ACTHMM_17650 [Agriterribacter sp.]